MNSHLVKLMAATAALMLTAIIAVCSLLLWSAGEVDRISRSHEREIVRLVLHQSVARVAHAQESSTVWDDAVRKLRERPIDLTWVDNSLGTWFSNYAKHDEVYLLDPRGSPIYAMRNGHRVALNDYDPIRPFAKPLIATLRETRDPAVDAGDDLAMLSRGASDLALIRGRPAILSLKPVVSDSGAIVQLPGSETLHLSIVYLDSRFVTQLGHQYHLTGARYAKTRSLSPAEIAVPLSRNDGTGIGFFIWQSFAPGRGVITSVTPTLIAAFLLGTGIAVILAIRLYRKTGELEISKAEAQYLALHDVLTGLPNRAMLERQIEWLLARTRRDGSSFALLYLDLDQFKSVNDSLGHPAGDALICEVAQRLTAHAREYDIVARLGGDEFAIILVEPGSPADVAAACTRILAAMAAPFDVAGVQTFVGSSIGVALAPHDGTDRTEMARKADIALYKSKSDGRGRYTFFSEDLDDAIKARQATGRDLRKALAAPDQQLKILYQPIFSAASGRVSGVEALLRWHHPDLGLITPLAFISLAEQTGLIEELGDWILRSAVRDAAGWHDLRLSVNVSSIQIRNPQFTGRLLSILAATGFPAHRLELEITETTLMDATDEIKSTLLQLRDAGVSIALDDFGTGYSSLSYIRDFQVDSVKIDQSFVAAIGIGNGAALVQAIITLAHASGMRVTAEGVETGAQLDFLKRCGCENAQGFLLGRPQAADEFAARTLPREARRRSRKEIGKAA